MVASPIHLARRPSLTSCIGILAPLRRPAALVGTYICWPAAGKLKCISRASRAEAGHPSQDHRPILGRPSRGHRASHRRRRASHRHHRGSHRRARLPSQPTVLGGRRLDQPLGSEPRSRRRPGRWPKNQSHRRLRPHQQSSSGSWRSPSVVENSWPGNLPGCTYSKLDSVSMNWLCPGPASRMRVYPAVNAEIRARLN
jgi:hypothetical protein